MARLERIKGEISDAAVILCQSLVRNRYVYIFLAFAVMLVHGSKLNSMSIGIDTEKVLWDADGIYQSWLSIGRQGLVWMKKLLQTEWFNPFFAGILILFLMVLSVAVFIFLFEYVAIKRDRNVEGAGYRLAAAGFGAIALFHPVLTEQLYFTLQGAEVLTAVIMLVGAVFCAHFWAETQNLLWIIGNVLFVLISFSVYQAMVPLYLFCVVAIWCLRAPTGDAKKEMIYILRHALTFLIGFGIDMIVTKLFYTSGGSYLSDQILWRVNGIAEGCRQIVLHMWNVVAGDGFFYFRGFSYLCLLVLLALVALAAEDWTSKKKWWIFVPTGALMLAPFYMTFLMGMRPVIRAQVSLPFVTGFLAYFAVSLLEERVREKWIHILQKLLWAVLGLVCICLIRDEANNTTRLYYTDAVRYGQDLAMAQELQREIGNYTGEQGYDGVVYLFGFWEGQLNEACSPGDVMGRSLFHWDTDVEPYGCWSSSRIVGFMHSIGAQYQEPSPQQAAEAYECAKTMPCYPENGSIAWNGEVLVIKLSERE